MVRVIGALMLALAAPGAGRSAPLDSGYLGPRFCVARDESIGLARPADLPDPMEWRGGLVLSDDGRRLYWLDPRQDRLRVADLATVGSLSDVALTLTLTAASHLQAAAGGALWCLDRQGHSIVSLGPTDGSARRVTDSAGAPWISLAAPDGAGVAAAIEEQSGRILLLRQGAWWAARLPELWTAWSAMMCAGQLYVLRVETGELDRVLFNGQAVSALAEGVTATATLQPVAVFPGARAAWPARNRAGAGMAMAWLPGSNGIQWAGLDHPEQGTLALGDWTGGKVVNAQTQPYFRSAVALAMDPDRAMAYAADAASDGIIGLRLFNEPTVGVAPGRLDGPSLAGKPYWGTERALVVGGSTAGRVAEGGAMALSFTELLELLYNTQQQAHGRSKRMQALLMWRDFGSSQSSGASLSLAALPYLKAAGVSRLLVTLTPIEPIFEAQSYQHMPVPDDLGDREQDMEWSMGNWGAWKGEVGPLTKAWVAALKRHAPDFPGIYALRPDGTAVINSNSAIYRLYDDPEVLAAMMARFGHVLQTLKSRAEEQGIRVQVLLVPGRNQLTSAEMVGGGRGWDSHTDASVHQALVALLRDVGLDYADPLPMVRSLDLNLWPFFVPGDDHYRQVGHWTLAASFAQGLVEQEPDDGPTVPAVATPATISGMDASQKGQHKQGSKPPRRAAPTMPK